MGWFRTAVRFGRIAAALAGLFALYVVVMALLLALCGLLWLARPVEGRA